MRFPVYFASKAESDVYFAFRTVASTRASKLQGKFVNSGSKKRERHTSELFVSFNFFDFAMIQWQELEIWAVQVAHKIFQ